MRVKISLAVSQEELIAITLQKFHQIFQTSR